MVKIRKGRERMEVSSGAYENFYRGAGWKKEVPDVVDIDDAAMEDEWSSADIEGDAYSPQHPKRPKKR